MCLSVPLLQSIFESPYIMDLDDIHLNHGYPQFVSIMIKTSWLRIEMYGTNFGYSYQIPYLIY